MNIQHFAIGLIIIFLSSVASGQGGWKKSYNAGGSVSVNFDDIQYYDDYLLIRGNAYLNKDNIWALLICAIDTNGLLLWQQTIFDTSKTFHMVTNTPSRLFVKKIKNF